MKKYVNDPCALLLRDGSTYSGKQIVFAQFL
jgi:hypothetical protein